MKHIIRHVALPSIAPALFFAVAATPVEVLGCRTRGLLALMIALVGALAGLGAAILAVTGRLRGGQGGKWWVATSLVLAIPAAAVVIIAYK